VILLDANIFMYAGGTPHPNKAPSLALLERVARGDLEAWVDAEVLQEILHRYRAIDRWEDGRRVFDHARQVVPQVIPITEEVLDKARELMDVHLSLTARDALHSAVYELVTPEAWCSYDRDFDTIPGLVRHEPPYFL
jgi:predicted nucleic acid-binding protein